MNSVIVSSSNRCRKMLLAVLRGIFQYYSSFCKLISKRKENGLACLSFERRFQYQIFRASQSGMITNNPQGVKICDLNNAADHYGFSYTVFFEFSYPA